MSEPLRIELNEHTRQILGRPNFSCYPIAQVLRKTGMAIPSKAEDEQAAAICWMLNLYLEHGERWAEVGESILNETAAKSA